MATKTTAQPSDALGNLQDNLAQIAASRLATLQFGQQLLAAKMRTELNEEAGVVPDVLTAEDRVTYYQRLSHALGAMANHEQHFPEPSPNAFILMGRIEDSQGNPLSNYRLHLTDPEQCSKGRIESAHSDHQGYFRLTLRASEYPDLVENKTDLFISVTDSTGREVFKPADPVHLEPGKVAVFSVVDSSVRVAERS